MQSTNQGKRIPASLNTDTKLFGRYTLADVAVAGFPGVLIALTIQLFVPPTAALGGVAIHSVTLPLTGGAILVGALFVSITPHYTSSIDWFATFLEYTISQNRHPHDDAKTITLVDRVHREHDAIERTDGALVGMVNIDPPAMALATESEWSRKAAGFQEFLNTTVEFPIQVYSTTREFPVDDYVGQYTARLDDPDVESNPELARLIQRYVDWYVDDSTQRPTTIRDHYIIVVVRPADVRFEQESLVQELAELPVLRVLLHALCASTATAERQAMFEALDERVRRVETGLRSIEGCNAQRVTIEDALAVLSQYWTGNQFPATDVDRIVRTRPLVATDGDPE